MRAPRPLPAFVVLVVLATARIAAAQQVFGGDPVDPSTGQAYPIIPGLPLLLPGDDEEFGTGDDVLNVGITGDVDLVVRSGSVSSASIPPPALAVGGPALATVIAGGGSSGQGAKATFTAMVSDGSGAPPYGNVVTNSAMDLRPVTVYAFADLDDDGILGPTSGDGSADNELERQEVTAYAGRQMGGLFGGRFEDSVGIELAAPASIGGLTVGLTAGAYTGTNANALFTDGPLILTRWPFFPPLDPKDLLGGGDNPAPDPGQPNQLEWAIEKNYLPSPNTPTIGSAFAMTVSGSEPTTDQLRVVSGPAISARVFADVAAGSLLARSRPRVRVAPAAGASGRSLVMPVERAILAADADATRLTLRVLPVDLFANVADPEAPITVTLAMSGSASLVEPDTDSNRKTETLTLADAEGARILLDDSGSGSARLRLTIGTRPVQTLALVLGAAADSDGDGVADDGNASSLSADQPCDAATASCDDNCPRVRNPSQLDSDQDGIGDCCDGTCITDPQSPSCDECVLVGDPTPPSSPALTKARLSLRSGAAGDKLTVKVAFELPPSASIAPDSETVMLAVTETGHLGYLATLASLFTDLVKPSPTYRYVDKTAAVDGVTRADVKCRANGKCTAKLLAAGVSLADLAAGSADLSLSLGDDLFAASLTCKGSATGVRCALLP